MTLAAIGVDWETSNLRGRAFARIVPGDASAARGLWRLANAIREQA